MNEVAKYLYDVYFGDNDIKDIHIKGQRYAVTCTITMNDTTPTEEDENAKESADEQEIEWNERKEEYTRYSSVSFWKENIIFVKINI